MAIKRYAATADTTITNAYKSGLTLRGTGSNMGASDALEVFSIYDQASTVTDFGGGGKAVKAEREYARTLVQFTSSLIVSDRSAGTVPADAKYYLRLFNVTHGGTLPTNYTMDVWALGQAWEEGTGLDMEEYGDIGAASWINRTSTPSQYASGSITVSTNPTDTSTPATIHVGVGGYFVQANVGANADATATALSSALEANSDITSLVNVAVSGKVVSLTASAASGDDITITVSGSGSDDTGVVIKSGNTLTGSNDYTAWTTAGGHVGGSKVGTFTFTEGTEDLLVDVTSKVSDWIGGAADYGFLIKLSQSHEEEPRSFYTKKFSGRGSEYWFKRPCIEARWDSSKADDRSNFYASSSLRSDNANTLFLYNYQDGTLINIPGNPTVTCRVYSDSGLSTQVDAQTATNPETGIYKASLIWDNAATTAYVKWHEVGGATFHTESISVNTHSAPDTSVAPNYVISLTNLKQKYTRNEDARFRLYTRLKDWSPTIYTVASKAVENNILPNAYYKIERLSDEFTVLDYGTGSTSHTKLSYDKDGNYFDFDMSLLEAGYSYGIKFMFYLNGEYREQPEVFKFKVV